MLKETAEAKHEQKMEKKKYEQSITEQYELIKRTQRISDY